MANPSKQKGTAWESAVVAYLNDHGFPYAERRALSGSSDRGDVAGIPGVVIECKAERQITLAGYMDEVAVEITNAGASVGVAIVKRRNRGVSDGYAVMTVATLAALLAAAEVTP